MIKLVLLRHGESIWNKENRFTGWTDVELSEKGIREAKEAGAILKREGYVFDMAFSSVLKRANDTLKIVLQELGKENIEINRSWRLNERHYGALQGLEKSETARRYGEEQVLLWRRSYDIRPPALSKDDERYPGKDKLYEDLREEELPLGECLKDTVERFLPFWYEQVLPKLMQGRHIIIAAHGNSLRALVKYLDDVTDEDIVKVNIPTGIPLVYELDNELKPIKHYYLGDDEAIRKAQENVRDQSKK